MRESDSFITRAAFFAGRAEESTSSTTSCTGHRFLRLCCSERQDFWDCWPVFCGGGSDEADGRSRIAFSPAGWEYGGAASGKRPARLLSRLQHDVAEEVLGRGHAQHDHRACRIAAADAVLQ